jgi:hypothetical protein
VAGTGLELYQEFNLDYTIDMVDSTAGAAAAKTYIKTVKDGKATLKLVWQGADGTATTSKFRNGQEGTLLWGPEGTASNKPKGGVYAFVTGTKRTIPYADLVTMEINLQFSGPLLFDEEIDKW